MAEAKESVLSNRDILSRIFSYIPSKNGWWFETMATCKLWNEVGRRVFDPSKLNALGFAVENDNVLCIRVLLKDERIDPSKAFSQDNYPIQVATRYGYKDIVKELLSHPKVDPSVGDNEPIRFASENGFVEIVKMLLKHERVDPSAQDNYAIRWAARNGHLRVVRELLKDKRVDPAAMNNYALIWANKRKHKDIVTELCKDPRVDASVIQK